MEKPDYLDQLIDLAQTNAGGQDALLAKMLGVHKQTVYAWRKGKAPCPVADQVLMAEIAGLKSEEWAARALIAQHEGTAKGDALYRALRKWSPAIGAVIASSGAHASAIFSTVRESDVVSYFIRCIVSLSYRKKRADYGLIA